MNWVKMRMKMVIVMTILITAAKTVILGVMMMIVEAKVVVEVTARLSLLRNERSLLVF